MANIKANPLFNANVRCGKTLSINEVCTTELYRTKRTLNDLCSKYGFYDVEDLERFCSNVLRSIRVMRDQENAMSKLCDSDVAEHLIRATDFAVRHKINPKDR